MTLKIITVKDLHERLAVRLIKLTNRGLLLRPTRTNIKNKNYDNNELTITIIISSVIRY